MGEEPPYSNQRLAKAWEQLLRASKTGPVSDALKFELLMVTRQVLGNYSSEIAREAADAWRSSDRQRLQAAGERMRELIGDLDELLATRPESCWANGSPTRGAGERHRPKSNAWSGTHAG